MDTSNATWALPETVGQTRQEDRVSYPLLRGTYVGGDTLAHNSNLLVEGGVPPETDGQGLSSYTQARSTNIPEMASGVQQIPLHGRPPAHQAMYVYLCTLQAVLRAVYLGLFFIALQDIPPNKGVCMKFGKREIPIQYQEYHTYGRDRKSPIIVSSGIGCLEATF